MGQFDDLLVPPGGQQLKKAGAVSEFGDLLDRPVDTKSLLDRAAEAFLKAGEYIPSPIKAALQAPGAGTGLLGRVLAPEAYQEALDENLRSIAPGRAPSTSEAIRSGPGLGQVFRKAVEYEPEKMGNIEKTIGTGLGMGLDIFSDPSTYLSGNIKSVPGLLKYAGGAAELTPEIAKGLQVAPELSRLGAGATAAARVFGSPAVGAIYGPEVIGSGLQAAAEGNYPQAGLMAGLAALMAHGTISEFTAKEVLDRAAGKATQPAAPGEQLPLFSDTQPRPLQPLPQPDVEPGPYQLPPGVPERQLPLFPPEQMELPVGPASGQLGLFGEQPLEFKPPEGFVPQDPFGPAEPPRPRQPGPAPQVPRPPAFPLDVEPESRPAPVAAKAPEEALHPNVKAKLKELNFSDQDISRMNPEVAAEWLGEDLGSVVQGKLRKPPKEAPTETQQTGPAMWKNKDNDQPVEVTGSAGVGPDGRQYVTIKDSNTAVPADEVFFTGKQEKAPVPKPEVPSDINLDRLIEGDDKAVQIELAASNTQKLRDLARQMFPERENQFKKAGKDDLLPLVAKGLKDRRAEAEGARAQAELDRIKGQREEAGLPAERGEEPLEDKVPMEGKVLRGEEALAEAQKIDPNIKRLADLQPDRLRKAARAREKAAWTNKPYPSEQVAKQAMDMAAQSRSRLGELEALGRRVLPSDMADDVEKLRQRVARKERRLALFEHARRERGMSIEDAKTYSKRVEMAEFRGKKRTKPVEEQLSALKDEELVSGGSDKSKTPPQEWEQMQLPIKEEQLPLAGKLTTKSEAKARAAERDAPRREAINKAGRAVSEKLLDMARRADPGMLKGPRRRHLADLEKMPDPDHEVYRQISREIHEQGIAPEDTLKEHGLKPISTTTTSLEKKPGPEARFNKKKYSKPKELPPTEWPGYGRAITLKDLENPEVKARWAAEREGRIRKALDEELTRKPKGQFGGMDKAQSLAAGRISDSWHANFSDSRTSIKDTFPTLMSNLREGGNLWKGEPQDKHGGGKRPWREAVYRAYFSPMNRKEPYRVFSDFPSIKKEIDRLQREHGIPLHKPDFIGAGGFNGVFKLGEGKKGPVVARIGTSVATPIPDKPWMLPFHSTTVTPEGWRVDVAPEVKILAKPLEPIPPSRLKEYMDLSKQVQRDDYVPIDLKPWNTGLHDGKLVVTDPGAVAPSWAVKQYQDADFLARQDRHYEGSGKATKEAQVQVAKLTKPEGGVTLKQVRLVPEEQSPVRRLYQKFWNTSKEGAAGVRTLASTVSKDFQQRGWVQLEGQRINPRNYVEDIALLSQLTRQSFEVTHLLAWDKEGQIVSHRAFTSGLPDAVHLNTPEFWAHMMELQNKYHSGEVAGYADVHNHPGGSPVASDTDLHGAAQLKDRFAGYKSSVITDHAQYGWVNFKKRSKGTDFGQLEFHEPESNLKGHSPEAMRSIGLDAYKDPMYDTAPLGRLAMSNDEEVAADVARLATKLLNDDQPRMMIATNDAYVRAAQSIPLKSLEDTEWLIDHITNTGSREGGYLPFFYHSPKTQDEAEVFSAAMGRLFDAGKLGDAVMPGSALKFFTPTAKERPGTVSWRELYGIQREQQRAQTAVAPKDISQAKARAEAYEASKPLAEKAPESRMPIPEAVVKKAAEEPKKPYTKPLEEARPRKDEKLGSNVLKDYPDLSPEMQREEASTWKAANSELKRASATSYKWSDVLNDAEKLYASMGKTPEQVVSHFQSKDLTREAREELTLALAVHRTAKKQEVDAYGKYLVDKTDTNKDAWIKSQIKTRAYGMHFINLKTEVGRLLKFLDQVKHGEVDEDLSHIGRWMAALKARGVPNKIVDQLRDIYTNRPQDFAAELEKALKPSWWDKIIEARTAGLVSGIPTRLANIGSNAIFRGLRDVENMVASGLDAARAKITGTERERYFGEAKAALMGYKHSVEGPQGIFNRWMSEHPFLPTQPSSEIKRLGGSFVDTNRSQGAIGPGFGWFRKLTKDKVHAGEVIRIPFKWLEIDDAFFKHASASQETFRRAYRKGYKEGLRGKALDQFVSKTGSEMLDVARNGVDSPHYSKYVDDFKEIQKVMLDDTFQDPLTGILSAFQTLQRNHPLARLVIPFVKTPANILIETMKRTPLGGYFLWRDYKKGLLKGGQVSEELAKTLIGSMIGAGMSFWAYNGNLTGGGPTDPRKKKLLRETGWLPYSVKIGDQYLSYQRFEPLSSIMGMASDYAEFVKKGDTRNANAAVEKLLASVKQNITNKTFLEGLTDFSNALSEDRYVGAYLRDTQGTLVPRILSRAAIALDPTLRKADFGRTAFQAQLPFASEGLDPVVSGLGKPIERGASALERFASPILRSTAKRDAVVERELVRLDHPIDAPRDYVEAGGKKVDLTKSEYQKLVEAHQAATKRALRVIQDPTYRALPDNALDPRYRPGRTTKETVIDRLYRSYRDMAKSKFKADVWKRAQSNP